MFARCHAVLFALLASLAAQEVPPKIAPAPAERTVSGVVLGRDGKPVAKARVSLWLQDLRGNRAQVVRDGRTESSGSFAFDGVEWLSEPDFGFAYYLVTARLGNPGDRDAAVALQHIRGTNVDPAKLRLQLREPVAVRGVVRAASGRPVAGAQVHVRLFRLSQSISDYVSLAEPMPPWRSRTGADGTFEIPFVPRGVPVTATATHRDFAQGHIQVVDPAEDVEFELEPGTVIAGRVTYASGKPAVRVQVQAQGVEHSGWGEAVTDDDGRYEIRSLRAEPFNIWATAHGFTTVAHDRLPTAAGETAKADLVLIEGGLVRGRFVDATTGKGVQPKEIFVGIYGPSRPRSGAAIEIAYPAADGSFELRVPPGSNYVYTIDSSSNYRVVSDSSMTVEVEAGEATEVEFKVKRAL